MPRSHKKTSRSLPICLLLFALTPGLLLGQGKKKQPTAPDTSSVGIMSIPTCAGSPEGCPNAPPSVTISAPAQVYVPGVIVTIDYCDDYANGFGAATVTLNGTNVTSSMSNGTGPVCPSTKRLTGTLNMAFGANTISSSICDVRASYLTPTGPLCGTSMATVTYRTVGVIPTYATVRSQPSSSGQRASFRVQNLSANAQTYSLTCTNSGTVSNCAPSLSSISVSGNSETTVDVLFNAGLAGTTGSVSLKAAESAQPANTYSAAATVNAGWAAGAPSPIMVSTVPTNGDHKAPVLCAVDCFDLTSGYSTPSYSSLGVARSATLTYRGSRARPNAMIELDVSDSSSPRASTVAVRMIDPNGVQVPFANGTTQIFYSFVGPLRVAMMDTLSRPTGAYMYRVELTSGWANGLTRTDTISVRVLVNNGQSSPYGSGWDLAGIQRLYPSGTSVVVLSDGADGISYYGNASCTTSGPCTFISPPSDFSTIQRVADGSYTRTFRNGTVVKYDQSGLMNEVRDHVGNATNVEYTADGTGRIKRIVDPMGKPIVFAYADSSSGGADKSLRTITDPMGRQVKFLIDASKDLTQITDPDAVLAFQGSYSSHLLSTMVDRRGGSWTYTVGSDRTLRAIVSPMVVANGRSLQPRVTFASPTAGIFDSVAAGAGAPNRPLIAVSPDNLVGRVSTTSGSVTTYRLNRFGQSTQTRSPRGEIVNTEYNQDALRTLVSGASGSFTATYGAGGKAADITSGGITTIFKYGLFDDDSLTIRTGDTTRYGYDAAHLCLTSVRSGLSTAKPTTYTCDTRGRVLTTTDPEGHRTRADYDPVTGNVAHVALQSDSLAPANRDTYTYYDRYGRDSITIDPLGAPTFHYWDAINRDTLTRAPKGLTVATHYDNLYVRDVVIAGTQQYRYFTNALGWIDSVTDATGTSSFTYDSTGTVATARNKRNQTTQYTYDGYGRIKTKTLADGRLTKFAYDSLDQWVSDSSAEGIDTLRTSARGTPVSGRAWRAGHRYEIRYGYNSDSTLSYLEFNRDSVAFPASGRSYYNYDSAGIHQYNGRLYGVSQGSANSRITLYHNADGLVSQIGFPSTAGTTIANTYASNDRVSEAYFNAPTKAAFERSYSWDKLARVSSVANYNETAARAFEYDSLGRLTKTQDVTNTPGACHPVVNVGLVCNPGSSTITATSLLSYDVVGNRTDGGAVIDPGNRLRAFNSMGMDYDADGNMIHRTVGSRTDTLFWNSENQLDSVRTPGGTVSFGYDGFGRRVRKSVAGTTTRYFYDGDNLYAQTDGAGNLARIYHYYPGVDTPAQMVLADGSLFHFMQDESGNVTGVINNSGQAVAQYNYSPFGVLESGSFDNVPGGNPLRFKGRMWDAETDLYENRARYYDAMSARFISSDPIGLEGGVNTYAFAGNDPVNGRDPSGTNFFTCELWETIMIYDDGSTEHIDYFYKCQLTGGDDGDPARQHGGGGGSNAAATIKKLCSQVKATAQSVADALNNGLGQPAGQSSADAWMAKYIDPSNTLAQNIGYGAGAGFAGLWTPDTWFATSSTLVGGYGARALGPDQLFGKEGVPGFVRRARQYLRWDAPHHGKGWHLDGIIPKALRNLANKLGPTVVGCVGT